SNPSGLARVDASLATNLLGPTPTEAVSESSRRTAVRIRAPISGGAPNSSVAPRTSTNASSSAMGSTAGLCARRTSRNRFGWDWHGRQERLASSGKRSSDQTPDSPIRAQPVQTSRDEGDGSRDEGRPDQHQTSQDRDGDRTRHRRALLEHPHHAADPSSEIL